MYTIYKYPLELMDEQVLLIPHGAQVLSVQYQRDQLCMWAMVDTDSPPDLWHVRIVGTGHPVPHHHTADFQGTVQDGPFVWHVFAWQEEDGVG